MNLQIKRITLLVLMAGLCWMCPAYVAAQKGRVQAKRVVVSTSDAKVSYEVMGFVSSRSGKASQSAFKDIERGLVQEAAKLKADAVVSVRFLSHAGYIFGCGTAVRFK